MENATNGDGNAEDQPMAMENAANGDCNGGGAEDPSMDMENAANGDGNGEGAGDPLGVELGANKKNGACSRCLCILSSNAQEKLCL